MATVIPFTAFDVPADTSARVRVPYTSAHVEYNAHMWARTRGGTAEAWLAYFRGRREACRTLGNPVDGGTAADNGMPR